MSWHGAIAAIAVAMAGAMICGPGHTQGITVSGAWIASPLRGRDSTVGYMSMRSRTSDRLIGVWSEAATRVEIHRNVRSGGRVRMEKLESIELRQGESVVFEPGGMHLMFFGVGGLGSRRTIEVAFTMQSGVRETATFTVGHGRRHEHGE